MDSTCPLPSDPDIVIACLALRARLCTRLRVLGDSQHALEFCYTTTPVYEDSIRFLIVSCRTATTPISATIELASTLSKFCLCKTYYFHSDISVSTEMIIIIIIIIMIMSIGLLDNLKSTLRFKVLCDARRPPILKNFFSQTGDDPINFFHFLRK